MMFDAMTSWATGKGTGECQLEENCAILNSMAWMLAK